MHNEHGQKATMYSLVFAVTSSFHYFGRHTHVLSSCSTVCALTLRTWTAESSTHSVRERAPVSTSCTHLAPHASYTRAPQRSAHTAAPVTRTAVPAIGSHAHARAGERCAEHREHACHCGSAVAPPCPRAPHTSRWRAGREGAAEVRHKRRCGGVHVQRHALRPPLRQRVHQLHVSSETAQRLRTDGAPGCVARACVPCLRTRNMHELLHAVQRQRAHAGACMVDVWAPGSGVRTPALEGCVGPARARGPVCAWGLSAVWTARTCAHTLPTRGARRQKPVEQQARVHPGRFLFGAQDAAVAVRARPWP